MHDSARQFCSAVVPMLRRPQRVAELGSRNVNGSIRYLFPRSIYIGVDALPGPGVDWVADGAAWNPGYQFDLVISTEALEHAADPGAVVRNMVALTAPHGVILITAATPEREPHSAIDGEQLRDGEHYHGITPAMLRDWFSDCRAVMIDDRTPGDVYCVAIK